MPVVFIAHPLGWLLAAFVVGCLGAWVWHVYHRSGAVAAWAAGGAAAVVALVLLYVSVRLFPRTRLGRGLVLRDPAEDGEEVTTATQAAQNAPEGATQEERHQHLLGKQGVARTPLRPSGVALFDEERVDVVTEGERIEPSARVKVVAVKGNRVVVRRVQV
jgi:membrane-bound serine protease (ClpP class)